MFRYPDDTLAQQLQSENRGHVDKLEKKFPKRCDRLEPPIMVETRKKKNGTLKTTMTNKKWRLVILTESI